ncbi:hypothetical protein BU15DRAFT_83792 [Melanogaster broomeanus]|nr:hypothetical protein BU15DRAFT_83792 [Melanogaster broomeanus]
MLMKSHTSPALRLPASKAPILSFPGPVSIQSTYAAVSDTEEMLDLAQLLISLLDALSLDELKLCEGVTEHLVQILKGHEERQETLISDVALW